MEKARARENQLRLLSLRRLDATLQDYITSLLIELRTLQPGSDLFSRQQAVKRAIEVARNLKTRLAQGLETAVTQSRVLSFKEILDLNNEAALEIAAAHDIPGRLLGAIQKPNVMMAGVWESLGTGAATWRTLLRGYVNGAVADAQYVMTRSLLEGVSADELARRLRPYLEGSQPFQQAFKGAGQITDKIMSDPTFTGAAKLLRYNADRIAMSEIHNARGEAELQSFAADPFVEVVRWVLSPNRGTQDKPDACDAFAHSDFYGLGEGVYPVTKVPTFPHPFCRCERMPVPRPISRMFFPKPNPARDRTAKVRFSDPSALTKVEATRVRSLAEEAITRGERTMTPGLSSLSHQSTVAANAPTRKQAGSPVVGPERRSVV